MAGKFKVYITDCDHADVEIEKKVLADTCDELPLLKCRTEDDVIARCADAEGLIIQYAPLTRRAIESLKHCKVMARYGVGVDTIDLKAATERGIVVCNVPDYGMHEVADHALALMLCLTRKISIANARVKEGHWDVRQIMPVFRHQVQTLGVISIGRIGGALAQKAHALGMKILAYDPYAAPERLPDYVKLVSLEELLRQSDVVSVHCPLTEETRNLFDEARLSLMKPTAYLVNTSRGHIVNEAALEKMLAEKRLAGAAFDVMGSEPPPANHPLFKYENFLCTPHVAWHSTEAAQELKRKAAEEVRSVLRGEAPRYQLNKA